MSVTSAPIGSTAQSLDGFAVDAEVVSAFRESVVITGPNVSTEIVVPTSTQPIDVYGLPVWMLGTPTVNVTSTPQPAGTTQVFGQVSSFAANVASTFAVNNPATVSTQIVSSIPFFVAQSSAPWDVRGNVGVTSFPAVASTVVVSSVPHALVGTSQVFGTVSTQVVSSLPIFVSQSSAPWTMQGAVNVSSQTAVSSSFAVGTTMVNVISTVAQAVNVTVVANNITSSIPLIVAQSSGPWLISPYATTAGGGNMTTVVCGAGLNATVIKAGPGQIYSINVSYFGSSQAFVKLANNSTAVSVSTAATKMLIGLQSSTNIAHSFPVGSEYQTGITMYTIRTPFAAGSGTTGILASSMTVSICYE